MADWFAGSGGARSMRMAGSSRDAITRFYEELDRVAEKHPELQDADAVAAVAETLNYFVVWKKRDERGLPRMYEMFSPEGDRSVASAVQRLVSTLLPAFELERVETPEARREVWLSVAARTDALGARFFEALLREEPPSSAKPLWDSRFADPDFLDEEDDDWELEQA